MEKSKPVTVNPRSCGKCRFSEAMPLNPQGLMLCRLNPPNTAMIKGPEGMGKTSLFPEVMPDWWCWKFEAKTVLDA